MATDKLTFEVEYCKNCDGGEQEFSAAKQAILDVFDDKLDRVVVVAKRVDQYPIWVNIRVGDTEIWSGDQRGLFKKNGHRAIPEVKRRLRSYRTAQDSAIMS